MHLNNYLLCILMLLYGRPLSSKGTITYYARQNHPRWVSQFYSFSQTQKLLEEGDTEAAWKEF